MSQSLEKLTIIPFSDDKYDKVSGDPYVALINPEQIAQEMKTEYTEVGGNGGSSSTKVFKMMPSPKMSLKFLFDGTGLIDTSTSAINEDAAQLNGVPSTAKSTGGTVMEQLKRFKEVAADFDGETHQPGYVKIFWGEVIFKGRITSLKITYTLFKPNGDPIRATADAVFEQSLDNVTKSKTENKSSPDLTHIRTVKQGDTLPLMCDEIYKNSKMYLEVARVNGLSNYRSLKVGTKIFFPPIKDEA